MGTSGSKSQTGNTAFSMSADWTRCFRCEMANVKLVILDVDTPRTTQCDKMAKILNKTLQYVLLKDISSSMKAKYDEINGVLTMPRFLFDGDKNEYLARQLCKRASVSQPFKQGGRNLHLEPSTFELLGSAIFTESDVASMPFDEHEVEIEIFATGMDSKNIMVSLRQIEYVVLVLSVAGLLPK